MFTCFYALFKFKIIWIDQLTKKNNVRLRNDINFSEIIMFSEIIIFL